MDITIPAKPISQMKLDQYKYNNYKKKWVKYETDKNTQKKNLKILTYNIWGALKDKKYAEYSFSYRSKAVANIIKDSNADIICLQEVNAEWLNFLKKNKFIRDNYYSIEKNTERIQIHYGLAATIFSKIPLYDIIDYHLPSLEMNNVATCNFNINNKKYTIATSQLQSSKVWEGFIHSQSINILTILPHSEP